MGEVASMQSAAASKSQGSKRLLLLRPKILNFEDEDGRQGFQSLLLRGDGISNTRARMETNLRGFFSSVLEERQRHVVSESPEEG